MDIEQEIDASYEETLRLLAEVIDSGVARVHIHPDFLRDLASELERLYTKDEESKSTIATLQQYAKY